MPASAIRVSALLLAGLLGYVMWLIGDRYVAAYVLIAVLVLVAGIVAYLGALWLAAAVLGRLVPARWRAPFVERRTQLVLVTAVSVFFLYRIGLLLNREWLPGRFHPLSLIGNAIFLFATLLLARALWKVRRPPVLVSAAVALATVFLGWSLRAVTSPERAQGPQTTGTGAVTQALATLPYITSVPESAAKVESGVVYFERERSFAGFNLCNSLAAPRALLLDMMGNVVHEWSQDIDPGYPWEFVTLCDNGDLLVAIQSRKLVRLDWDSRVKWVRQLRCHHDLDVAANGDIYVLQRAYDFVSVRGLPTPVRDDHLVILSPDGELKSEFSVGELLRDTVPLENAVRTWIWQLTHMKFSIEHRMQDRYMFDKAFTDLLHLNTVTIVDRDYGELLRRGHVIVCSPMIDVVAIIDPEKQELVWQWGAGVLEGPHNPTVLDNGNLLIFDNGVRRHFSSVVEVDPAAQRIVWSYEYDPRDEFYSPVCGASQRLPNGNTLITHSVGGRVFEVAPDGHVVWDLFTPIPGDEKMSATRPTIYRMERVSELDGPPQLKNLRAVPTDEDGAVENG